MIGCLTRARASLIGDGMDADEAAEAVQPPSSAKQIGRLQNSSADPENPHNKLKKCSISLKRLWYIEESVKSGKTILFVNKSKPGRKNN